MMHVADTRDCAFEAFITNLGKYNEGFLVGEWMKFPVTNEEMQEVFRRIGIGRRYEEWFITDYDCPDTAIGKVLGEYESLSELSSVAADGSVMISEAAVGMRADGSVPSTRPSVVFGTLLRQPVSSAAHRASVRKSRALVRFIDQDPPDIMIVPLSLPGFARATQGNLSKT